MLVDYIGNPFLPLLELLSSAVAHLRAHHVRVHLLREEVLKKRVFVAHFDEFVAATVIIVKYAVKLGHRRIAGRTKPVRYQVLVFVVANV